MTYKLDVFCLLIIYLFLDVPYMEVNLWRRV